MRAVDAQRDLRLVLRELWLLPPQHLQLEGWTLLLLVVEPLQLLVVEPLILLVVEPLLRVVNEPLLLHVIRPLLHFLGHSFGSACGNCLDLAGACGISSWA